MRSSSRRRLFLLSVAWLSMAVSAHAVTITWDGSTDGNWGVTDNWDLNQLPMFASNPQVNGDDIVLPAVAPNKTQTAISLGSGGTGIRSLTLEGGYFVGNPSASIAFGAFLSSTGSNEIAANISHQNAPSYSSTGGTLTFSGNHSTKGLNLQGSGDIIFNGTVTGGGGRQFVTSNTGTVRINNSVQGFTANNSSRASGTRINAAGSLLVNSSIDTGTNVWMVNGGGTLGGNGSLGAEPSSNTTLIGSGIVGVGYQPNTLAAAGDGTISPGDPLVSGGIGTLGISSTNGIFFGGQGSVTDPASGTTQNSGTATGTLLIQLADGSSDLLNITGDLNLASTNDELRLTHLPLIAPSGDYTIAAYTGTRTGKFDSVFLNGLDITSTAEELFLVGTGRYRLDYGSLTNGQISLVTVALPVPEPTTAILLAPLAIFFYRRRRSQRSR